MRIAQVAPLYESVPPQLYGGTERVVSYLTEELVRQGHEVTLFASGDSVTRAKLVAPCGASLRLDPTCVDRLAPHITLLDQVLQRAEEFEVIHFHIDYLHYPASRHCRVPHVTTLHGRLDLADLVPLYRQFPDVPVVSISDAQRKPLPYLNWQGTVYHGLPDDLYRFHPKRGEYLAFVGRISPEKRVDRAIEIARRSGWELKIAAKVDEADCKYFEDTIRPLLGTPGVEFIGEIGEDEKDDFVGNAAALLFPIDWPEPFGLVLIEAMACGTPVVAWCGGSVPEVIDDEVSGWICENMDEAVRAVGRIGELSRAGCRQQFLARFRAARMAEDYVQIYERLVRPFDHKRPDLKRSERKQPASHGRDHPSPGPVLHSGHVVPRT
jgi:glycosyltransferase involved in cell wall biosynthesis